MEKNKIESLTTEVSDALLNSINMLEILEDITDGEKKEYFLVSSIQKNIDRAFNNIEICRQMTSVPD